MSTFGNAARLATADPRRDSCDQAVDSQRTRDLVHKERRVVLLSSLNGKHTLKKEIKQLEDVSHGIESLSTTISNQLHHINAARRKKTDRNVQLQDLSDEPHPTLAQEIEALQTISRLRASPQDMVREFFNP